VLLLLYRIISFYVLRLCILSAFFARFGVKINSMRFTGF